jgi:NMD protein affecting ribosome stability and mRNA decay
MSRIICHRCRESIPEHDFYIESRGGAVCSACILAAESRQVEQGDAEACARRRCAARVFVPRGAWADASS